MLQMTAGLTNKVVIFGSKIYVSEKVLDQNNKHYQNKKNMKLHFLHLSSFVVGAD